jgi:hypothetical protein
MLITNGHQKLCLCLSTYVPNEYHAIILNPQIGMHVIAWLTVQHIIINSVANFGITKRANSFSVNEGSFCKHYHKFALGIVDLIHPRTMLLSPTMNSTTSFVEPNHQSRDPWRCRTRACFAGSLHVALQLDLEPTGCIPKPGRMASHVLSCHSNSDSRPRYPIFTYCSSTTKHQSPTNESL